MIKSIIASSHHYYLAFFDSAKIKNVSFIATLFGEKYDAEAILSNRNKNDSIFHLQIELPNAYGSETMLGANKSREKNGTIYYWYDFYYGQVDSVKKIYFICYPYSRLGKFIERAFDSVSLQPNFYKADVKAVLKYMRNRGHQAISRVERDGFDLDITKYTAEVKEEANANKVSLIGINPLNSRIFDVLNETNSLSIEATALKLKCKRERIGELELSFDRLGNFRFWLKRDLQVNTLPVVPYVFQFFSEIASIEKSHFLSTYSLLEDE